MHVHTSQTFALLLLGIASAGCSVGLAKHPLRPEQRAALASRDAPSATQDVDGLTTVRVEVPVDAPVDVVWQRLAVQYGDVHEWSGLIVDSDFVDTTEGHDGAVRSCKLGPNSPIGKNESFREAILVWDPARHFFLAGVEDGFYPMRQVAQEFWVEPSAEGSTVITQFHYDLAFPMGRGRVMRKRLKPNIVRSLLGLKHIVETGDAAQSQDTDYLAERYASVLEANGV